MISHPCVQKTDIKKFNNLSSFLKVISEENRLQILCLLKRGELCVCEIYENLGLSQNLTSSHLKVLKDFNLINSRRDWKRIYYSLDTQTLNKYSLLFNNILKSTANTKVDKLKQ